MCRLRIGILWLTLALAAHAEGEPDARFRVPLDRIVDAYNAGRYADINQDFSPAALQALPDAKITPFFTDIAQELGRIQQVEPAELRPDGGAVFLAHLERGDLDIILHLDAQDRVVGLTLLPHTERPPAVEKHKTPLRLPFNGRWSVVWGGDTKDLNNHHDSINQKFAFDFVIARPDGRSFNGKGTSNEDYLAYGAEIVAPAAGVVIEAIDGVRDNRPGSLNPYVALGNAVLIQHAPNEVSVLAHLKPGSLTVKAGDKVSAGQLIGLCGNSGNSSEPHLHYHLQNTPIIQDGKGIKCLFRGVSVDRNGASSDKEEYSPIKGDIVLNQ